MAPTKEENKPVKPAGDENTNPCGLAACFGASLCLTNCFSSNPKLGKLLGCKKPAHIHSNAPPSADARSAARTALKSHSD